MNVINLSSDYIFLYRYRLPPLETIVVPNYEYNSDDILAAIINSAYNSGRINVTSPPIPFPRTGVHGESNGATGTTDVSPDEENLIIHMEVFA